MYFQRRGGPSDGYERAVEALKWLKLSAMKGVISSKQLLERIKKKPPPSSVMAEADRRVARWQPIVDQNRDVPAWWLRGTVNC